MADKALPEGDQYDGATNSSEWSAGSLGYSNKPPEPSLVNGNSQANDTSAYGGYYTNTFYPSGNAQSSFSHDGTHNLSTSAQIEEPTATVSGDSVFNGNNRQWLMTIQQTFMPNACHPFDARFLNNNHGTESSTPFAPRFDSNVGTTGNANIPNFDYDSSESFNREDFCSESVDNPGYLSNEINSAMVSGSMNFSNYVGYGETPGTRNVAQNAYLVSSNESIYGEISAQPTSINTALATRPLILPNTLDHGGNTANINTAQNAFNTFGMEALYGEPGTSTSTNPTSILVPMDLISRNGPRGNTAATRPKHQCPHCPKSYARRGDLTRHVVDHRPDPPRFPCIVPGCERSRDRPFNRKDKLRDHLRRVHDLVL